MADLYARVAGERLVNTTRPGNQTEPRTAALDGGGYVVVWTDQNVTGNYESRGQVFDATGNPVGSEFLINANGPGNQFQPKVAALDGGGFVVSFTDGNGDGATNTGVRVQMFDATGAKVGSELTANQTTAGNQLLSTIVGLPGGGFLATWQESAASSGDVRARLFDSSGAPTGGEFTVNTATLNTQRDGWAAVLSDGTIVISWQDSGGADGSGVGVRAQRYSAAGVAIGAEFGVNTVTSGSQGNHNITALKDGGFVVTWEDHSQDANNAVVTEIRAQLFNNSGAKVGGEIAVNSYTLLSQITPSVAALDSGGFVIVWDDASGSLGETQDGGSHGIHAQVFNADGSKDGIDFLVNTTIPQNQWLPTVAGLAGGGFAVSWVDASGLVDTTGFGIVTQVFGVADGTITDIALTNATVNEAQPENMIVGTLSADGPVNADRKLVYTIVSDSTGGGFGIKGDKLIVADNARLDYEAATSATVTVRVTDKDGHSWQEALTIAVTDATDETRRHAGNDIDVNATNTNSQTAQAMAALTGGGFVITWTDASATGGDTAGSAIRAQRFDADGHKLGGEFLVNTTTAGNQATSAVTAASGGGFLVVWQDAGATPAAIRGQFFDAGGAKVGSEFQVDDATGAASLPVATLLNSGNFLVSWQDASGDAGTSTSGPVGIRGQLVDATGAKVGSEFTLNTQITQAQENPAIATTATGFVASWVDRNSSGFIRAQFFDNTGAIVGGEFQVNTNAANNQLKPTATVLANGDVLFTWWDLSLVGGDNSNGGIKGRLYNSSGAAITGEFLVNTTISLDQDAPRVAALAGGGFIVVFEDRSENALGNIRAQQFDAAGNKVGQEFIATYSTSYAQKLPTIAVLADGSLAIAWQDGTNFGFDALGWGVKARVFSAAVAGADPVANADSLSAPATVATNFAAAALLGNDTHAFGTLAIAAVTAGTGGTVKLELDGSVTFTPAAGFSGNASFSYVADDGEGGRATGTVTVDVVPPIALTGLAASLTVTEGDAPALIDSDVTLAGTDFDGGSLVVSGALGEDVVSIHDEGAGPGQIGLDGGDVQYGGVVIGSWSGGAGSDLEVTFNAAATAEAIEALIENLAFANTSDAPTADRTLTVTVTDAAAASAGADVTVSVTAVNDAPDATADGAAYAAAEQVALDIKNSGLLVADSDAGSGSVTVTLGVDFGVLDVTAGGSGVGVAGSGTASVTLTGTLAAINALLNSDATSTVSYTASGDAPPASATLTLAIDDDGKSGSGGALSDDATKAIAITPANDAPTVTFETISGATEQVGLDLKAAIVVDDPDGPAEAVTVTLSVDFGVLAVTAGTSGAGVSGSGTASVTITGTLAQVQALLDSDATSTVTYTANSDTPPASAVLEVTVDDGIAQATDSHTIAIAAGDDAAVAADDTTPTVAEDATVTIDVLANDADVDGPSPTIATVNGATLTAGDSTTLASGATVTLNGDGTLTYDPAGSFNTLISTTKATATGALNTGATDSFAYTVAGGDSATVTVTITGVDSPEDWLAGGGGNDVITGTPAGDSFILDDGGDDTVTGLASNDGFYMGAALSTGDDLDGGAGINDQLGLQGDYSAGYTFGAANLSNIEVVVLLAGIDTRFGASPGAWQYDLTTVDANVAAGGILTVNAGALLATESLTFDGTAETDGAFRIFASQGIDDLTGGQQSDGFFFGIDNRLTAADQVDGQGGADDQLGLRGDYSGGVTFTASTMTGIETVVLLSASNVLFAPPGTAFSYNLTLDNANVASGERLMIQANGLQANESATVDGSAESDGWFTFMGGLGADSFIGGANADRFYGRLGADTMTGNGGDDIFYYRSADDSTLASRDFITDFTLGDTIDLTNIDANAGALGNNAFAFIGSAAFSSTAGELRVNFIAGLWAVEGDTNGDGVADLVISLATTAGHSLAAGDFVL